MTQEIYTLTDVTSSKDRMANANAALDELDAILTSYNRRDYELLATIDGLKSNNFLKRLWFTVYHGSMYIMFARLPESMRYMWRAK